MVLEDLLELASQFSGRQALPASRLYADLDINGSDFIEFVVAVERRFAVDLSWVSPRAAGEKTEDATIEAIANFVLLQRTDGNA